MPRQSMNTRASQLRAKRRTGRRSSPAIWLETFPAVRWTFDSFSNLKATRSRRWKSFRERWLQSRVFTGISVYITESMTSPEMKAQIRDSMDKMAISPDAIARAIVFAIEQPADVDVGEIIVRPTAQG